MVLTSMCVFGQARPGVYPWAITVKIVDDLGQPVNAAKVQIGYTQGKLIEGLTETNGTFSASRTDRSWELGIHAKKDGYYSSYISYTLYLPGQFDEQKVASNRNATLTLVLKKVGRPIPMYAKSLNTHVPDLDKPIGYDLMVGDWIGPYGSGICADILFTGHFDKNADGESDFTLTVSFPKNGDGIQEFDVPNEAKGSGLHSPHEAPVDSYRSQWVQTDNRRPGKPIETNRNPNRNYFLRVRTVIDDRGNIVSTHYGKIYGDFMRFSYYLNPTPNSRNVEFDPKQNLMKNLKPDEGATAP